VALYRIILNALPILLPANLTLRENVRNLFASVFSTQDEQDEQDDDFVLDNSPASSLAASPPPPRPSLQLHKSPGDRREARLSSSAQVHQIWMRRKTRRWHSVLAGAIAGVVAISFEKRARRNVIAQQLFVRYVSISPSTDSGTYYLTVGCKAHTMLTRKNAVSVFRMVTFWSFHWRTSLFSSVFRSVLMSEKVWADRICISLEPAHAPKGLPAVVRREGNCPFFTKLITIS
jgi:hypothetical protein